MHLPGIVALVFFVCVSYIVSSHTDWDALSAVKFGLGRSMSSSSIRVRIKARGVEPKQLVRVLSVEDSEMKRADISCGDVFCSCSFFTSRPMEESTVTITTTSCILITSLSLLITRESVLSTRNDSSIH